MQQSNPTQEELKNLTVEELKEKLNTMGVHVDSSRKAKKTYIELILKAAEVGKSKNEVFQAPLKTLKNNYISAGAEVSGSKFLPKDFGGESTRTEDNSFMSGSNLYPSSYNTLSNINLKPNLSGQAGDKAFLSSKRESQNKINNKYDVNLTDVSGKYSNFNLQDKNTFTGRSQSRQLTESRIPGRHVSSKSIKDMANLTSSAINNALNNTNIDLIEHSASGIQAFARTPSRLSIVSKTVGRKIKSPGLPILNKFKKTNGDVDYKLLLSVVGGSLSVYAFLYYLQKYCTNDINCFESIFKFAETNQDAILKGGSIVIFAALVFLVYLYIKKKAEYHDFCHNLATKCYQITLNFFESKAFEHPQHNISETCLINDLSKRFSFPSKKFTEDVYTPFLKNMLIEDSRFKIKDLVDSCEIQAFLIYEYIEN